MRPRKRLKEAVEGFVRRWEFESALRVGSAAFKMMYAGVDIIDRNPPPPGVVPISGTFRSRPVRTQARLPKRVSEYPSPHSGRPIEPDHPDALFMLSRLDLYRQRREPLASVAYICLTVLEGSAAPGVRGRDQRRAKTAGYYRIEKKILDVVGALSSEKGCSLARKSGGSNDAFTKQEVQFLEASVTAFTRRAAEKAADPIANLPLIAMADLPNCE